MAEALSATTESSSRKAFLVEYRDAWSGENRSGMMLPYIIPPSACVTRVSSQGACLLHIFVQLLAIHTQRCFRISAPRQLGHGLPQKGRIAC